MPLRALREAPCHICKQLIPRGETTRPLTNSEGGPLNWCHLACVGPDDSRVPICKHWASRGVCMLEAKCFFRHSEEFRNSNVRQRKRHGSHNRQQVFNDGRVGALRRWLLDVFGEDYLRSGSGIIDVAGGKGELSFEFENLNGIKSCVFDPRPLLLNRYCRKLQFGYYHRNDILGNPPYVTFPRPISNASAPTVALPAHIRGFFEMPGVGKTPLSSYTTDDLEFAYPSILSEGAEEFADGLLRGREAAWTSKGLRENEENGGEGEDSVYVHDEGNDILQGEEILHFGDARDRVRSCSAIVGMHPDQAAEHILEFAIQNDKPCAIIPCCVYSSLFPKRRCEDGRPVRKYGDLVEYLMSKLRICIPCAKDDAFAQGTHSHWSECRFGAVELDFEGMNILIFYLGTRPPMNDPYKKQNQIARGPASQSHWEVLSS